MSGFEVVAERWIKGREAVESESDLVEERKLEAEERRAESKEVSAPEGRAKALTRIIRELRAFYNNDEAKVRQVVQQMIGDLTVDDIVNEVRRYDDDLAELVRMFLELRCGR